MATLMRRRIDEEFVRFTDGLLDEIAPLTPRLVHPQAARRRRSLGISVGAGAVVGALLALGLTVQPTAAAPVRKLIPLPVAAAHATAPSPDEPARLDLPLPARSDDARDERGHDR